MSDVAKFEMSTRKSRHASCGHTDAYSAKVRYGNCPKDILSILRLEPVGDFSHGFLVDLLVGLTFRITIDFWLSLPHSLNNLGN